MTLEIGCGLFSCKIWEGTPIIIYHSSKIHHRKYQQLFIGFLFYYDFLRKFPDETIKHRGHRADNPPGEAIGSSGYTSSRFVSATTGIQKYNIVVQ